MMMKKSFRKKRTSRPKRRLNIRRTRIRRPVRNVRDYAGVSVSTSLTNTISNPPTTFVTGQMYRYYNFNLAQFARASSVAQSYQHFRIKSIKLTFKASADTFTSSDASKPYLYYLIDKSGSLPVTGVGIDTLKQSGCIPHTFDEREKVVIWRPSVLEGTLNSSGSLTGSKYRVSPWLSTNDVPTASTWSPSTIPHLGIVFTSDCLNYNQAPAFQVDMEVQFQFKKPIWQPSANALPQVVN